MPPGSSLAEPVHYDGRAETEALKLRYADWLEGVTLPRPGPGSGALRAGPG